jgi:hypothetical protein
MPRKVLANDGDMLISVTAHSGCARWVLQAEVER